MAKLTLAGKIYNILEKYEDKQERVGKFEALFNEYIVDNPGCFIKDIVYRLVELSVPNKMCQFVVKVTDPSKCFDILSVNLSYFQKESDFIIRVRSVYERLHADMSDFDIYQSTGVNDHYPTAVKHLDERWNSLSKYTKFNRSDMALKGEAYYGVKLVEDNTYWKKGPAFNYDDSQRPHTCSWLRPLIVM